MSKAAASGRKQKAPPAPTADSDDEQFHPLPPEPAKKKQKKGAAAHVPVLDTEAAAKAAAAAAAAEAKKGASAAASVAASAANAARKNGGKRATVPVHGVPMGEDDEDLGSDSDEEDGKGGRKGRGGDDSGDEAQGRAVVKAMSKTAAKEARVYERPPVSAKDILPDPQARTPSHVKNAPAAAAAASSSAAAAAAADASGMLAGVNAVASLKPLPSQRKVIIVLVKASLETVKTKKGYELISADSHKHVLQKLKKNPSEYRPDILHQCLLTLLDSPLNKAGMLQVYVQTEKVRHTTCLTKQHGAAATFTVLLCRGVSAGTVLICLLWLLYASFLPVIFFVQNVLIEVHSSIRIPRTFKRFAGLMGQSPTHAA